MMIGMLAFPVIVVPVGLCALIQSLTTTGSTSSKFALLLLLPLLIAVLQVVTASPTGAHGSSKQSEQALCNQGCYLVDSVRKGMSPLKWKVYNGQVE